MKLTGGAYLTTVQRTIFTIWNCQKNSRPS